MDRLEGAREALAFIRGMNAISVDVGGQPRSRELKDLPVAVAEVVPADIQAVIDAARRAAVSPASATTDKAATGV
jgi:hypothetical protein